MKFFPALDLMHGKAVRLEAGEKRSATIFHEQPLQLVPALANEGADRLHVVDLDGAFGEPRQLAMLQEIIATSPIPVQVGGGIRDTQAVDQMFALGAAFVILGTAAVKKPVEVEALCRAYPKRIIVAVDARDGVVAVDGWTLPSGISATQLGQMADDWGCAALLYTDVARDGMRTGPNVAMTTQLAHAVKCEVYASGGVAELDDIARLRDANIAGVVVGRALYEGRFTVGQAAHVAHHVS
ncbi:MAG TPA: 1-(5-phosphoribosyl)-5-[(5-phosphoribosylamino)methylideneamino]imidazole-4-carboxamide isomerase [Kofleriaceae bacterium]|nr:1-(5-phosphoribosyl)-5-[(5-phosphoribosylamino)methylideneamino]imidazole-4-carboxamide isomerase [Kofleriaceae bacterium]